MKKIWGSMTVCMLVFCNPLFNVPSKRECEIQMKLEKVIAPITLEEYVKGVVATEMPASYHVEALKSQAIAARTYTLQNQNLANSH